ncbi:FAD-dependent oxidoreductase [Sutterella megalosphaeroides]|uniref:FAD-dependent oxidoreductase 2 FAD-binding domain-containing protein n=1 Tax=Sutterella megalosphaeroides TaxID=2494234 RepID=A0A2Z6IAP9_9BURK|nr:FAD-dependent oxidoreductase [Sutterella megalosphaeroides]BBF23519.1 hypothetical protein SUTMEG_14100 [Sutterella megalosphaeroides]
MRIAKTVVAASVSLMALCAQAGIDPATLPLETLSADVVVVGAGGTGMAAAAAAAEKGAKVIVFEKMPMIGGSSAFAGGAIAGGSTNLQKKEGVTDATPEGFIKIWLDDQKRSFPGGNPAFPDVKLVDRMGHEFTETVNWLETNVGHQYASPRPFGYGGPRYAHAPLKSPVPASGRGSSPAGGRFVIESLKTYTDKLGVDIRTATPVDDLVVKDGAVVGVTAHNKTTRYEVSAKAVVLATGGFAHNKEMLAKFVPQYAPFADLSVATVGATGDGIRMAVKAGGVMYDDAWVIGLYVNSLKSELTKTFTTKDKYKDRVFVNQKGERFVNENLPYLTDYVAEQEKAWAIVDSADAEKVKVLVDYPDAELAVGANTWEELARKMGVPPEALKRTMDAYNEACETGDDKAFKKPKTYLKPFLKAPFYAVRVVPQTGGTMGGVKVNDKFQVVRADGSPVKGLYAGGEVQNRPYYGRVYTSGTGLGIAYTSGRIAGGYAAEEK